MRKFALLLLLLVGCAWPLQAALKLTLLEEKDLQIRFLSDADTLAYDRPLVGTLEVISRATEEVTIPNLQRRFQGFSFVEDFAAGKVEANGKMRARYRFRLTPEAVGPWALRPFVVTIKNVRSGATRDALTNRVVFPAPPALPMAEGAPEADLTPEWVAPGWRTFRVWIFGALALVVLFFLCRPLFKRVKRALYERTLSPEERARLELDRLLAEGLLTKGLFKTFYYGLSNVVRRYFERGYALRATRQTSQEFLTAISDDTRISSEERAALAQFLTIADVIKFAGVEASATEAEAATQSVRELIAQAAAHRAALEAETNPISKA